MAKKTTSNSEKSPVLSRPPVVVVLGHVDHGKTTLLDAIRQTDVAAREYGGITQSIGAYQVEIPGGKKITFIDTPGHEAFQAMRSRGVLAADIAVLVVAANDSVMPQTAESIKIIKDAGLPYLVAVNKIDLPEANFDKVVKDLLRHEVMLENYGGDIPFLKISAKNKQGIKELLDLIFLISELNEINGDPGADLEAIVIESRLDKNRGPLATVILRNGSLQVTDKIYVDNKENKIRALINFKGENIKTAGPGDPVEILGLSQVPPVGSKITSRPMSDTSQINISDISTSPLSPKSSQEKKQSLNLILKSNTLGTLEAVTVKIPANVNLIQSSVGEINEADILLAKSTGAIALGFNVKVSAPAAKLAENEKVLVRTYKIIYELLDELEDAAAGMLEPVETEEELGRGQVIAEFPFEKMRIAGTKIISGRVARGDMIKISRPSISENDGLIGKSKIKSVRISKDEVNKVEAGKDCGLLLDPQIDFQIGDAIISYRLR